MADWSDLPSDLLERVATTLHVFEDFTALRGVCTSWRAAVAKDRFVSRVPLLMLAEKDGDGDVREFYSLYKRKVFSRVPVPEAKGKRCIGAGFGWYLTVAASGGELNLVKPLNNNRKIQLPNMMSFPRYVDFETLPEYGFMGQAALSANPSETSDFVLMVGVNENLGFWKNGDSKWTKIEMKESFRFAPSLASICYHRNKMYVIDCYAHVWMWDPCVVEAPARIILKLRGYYYQIFSEEQVYLVESTKGELLVIIRNSLHRWNLKDHYNGEFEIDVGTIQVDTVTGKYNKWGITLKGDAIFIGQNGAVAVAAADYPRVIKANCIYFTDDDLEQYTFSIDGGGADMGIYHVEEDRIERFHFESRSFICPPLWVFP